MIIFLPFLSLLMLLSFNSCNSASKKYSSYKCPMDCEHKTYDQAGDCPICEMELEGIEK